MSAGSDEIRQRAEQYIDDAIALSGSMAGPEARTRAIERVEAWTRKLIAAVESRNRPEGPGREPSRPSYVIFECTGREPWLSPALSPHLMTQAVTQPPISSRDEMDHFVRDLQEAGDRVFGPSAD